MRWLIKKITRNIEGRALAYLLLLSCVIFSFLFILTVKADVLISGPKGKSKKVSEISRSLMPKPVKGAINTEKDLGGLKKKYKVQVGTDEVEVGDFSSENFKPQVKLKRWGDEAYLNVEVPDAGIPAQGKSVGVQEDRVNWESATMGAGFYKKEKREAKGKDKNNKEHSFVLSENGGFEFEIVLYEYPESNVITLPIQTKGLKFYYQGPLTEEEKNAGVVRPDEAVGSYAVYHESKKDGQYNTGKAFHIYRPLIIDAEGSRIWGTLNIDTEAKVLKITISQSWLSNAVYPVVVDPEFGYTSIGSSAIPLANVMRGSIFTASAFSPASITAYLENTDTTAAHNAKYAIYKAGDTNLLAQTREVTVPAANKGWYEGLYTTSFNLSAEQYALSANGNSGNILIYFDDGAPQSQQSFSQSRDYTLGWPATTAGFSYEDRIYSIYDAAGATIAITVTLDATVPTAAITYSDADGIVKNGDSLTITATFSESMADAPVPQITIFGANTQTAINMVKASATVYTYTHTVGAGDGTATVALSTGTDLAGNVVTSAPTSGANFTVDNTVPVNSPCDASLAVTHTAGAVAPTTKSVTYGIVNTSLSGASKCWITQNLGANNQAASATDNTAAAAGWYWQFNRQQGYADGPTPAWTITGINEASDWILANDPCNLLLGAGWRMPTSAEWSNADSSGGWNNYTDSWNSVLKLHANGSLTNTLGNVSSRGSRGWRWSTTNVFSTQGYLLDVYSTWVNTTTADKAYGCGVRCFKDALVVVFGASITKKGGDVVTIVSSGDATNNVWFAPSGTTVFVAGATMTTAGGTATTILAPATAGAYKLFVLDAAGNRSVESAAILTVENTPPTAAITYSDADGIVKSGDSLTITATFSESMADSPVVQIAISGANTRAATNMVKTDATHYTYIHTVGAGDGAATVALSTGTDLVGNVVTSAPTSGATFTVDNTAPGNQNTVFASNVTKKGGDPVTIASSGDATNNVWFAPLGTTVFVAGPTMTKAANGIATSILAPANAGGYKLFVLDAAGNYSAPSTATLTVENTPPTAAITYSDADGIVKSGDSLTITATFSESMADSPVVQIAISGANTRTAINMVKTDATHYTYTHTVGAGDGAATVALSTGTDLVGNVVTSAPTSGATFTVDNTSPVNGSVCGSSAAINHIAGPVAPINKTVTYGTVSTTLGGTGAKCWITQNLGATNQAVSATDATEAAGGWYWQFNRTQGYYQPNANYALISTATPNTWDSSTDSTYTGWDPAKDPCTLLLGAGWRLPTSTEWTNADATGAWANYNNTYASVLKLHTAGFLHATDGKLYSRDSEGYYWSSTQFDGTTGNFLYFLNNNSYVFNLTKAYGFSIRCLNNNNVAFDIFFPSVTKKGGDVVTIASSGDATNNIWFAPLGTTVFVAGPTMTKAANGISTSILAPVNAGEYKLFLLDAAGNYSAPSTATLTVENTPPTAAITYSDSDGIVKVGDFLTITATFSESMADAPVVQIAISGANTQTAINMVKTDATHYTYTHAVGAGDGAATVALSTGTDLVGNVVTSAPTSGATFTVDNNAPSNQNTVFASSVTKKGGDPVIIVSSGDSTNNVWFAPLGTTVFVAGPTMTKAANGTALSILAPATAGDYKLFVLDAAGNYSAPSAATLTVENTSPTAAITYSDADGIVKSGDSLTITATFSESMADSPVVQIAISGANTQIATPMTKTDAMHYTYTHTVGAGDGAATVALSTGTDLVGNVVTSEPTSGATFTVDNTAPGNQNTVLASSVTKKGGDPVTIVSSGDATNNIWFAPSGTTVFVAGPTMTKAVNGIATSILAPANEGDYKLFVIDAAGNYSAPSTATLTVDNTSPTAAVTYADADGIVKSGDSLTITATFNESMADAPVLQIAISGVNSLAAIAMTKMDATHYTFTHTVGAGDGAATVALSIGTDIAGNVITSAPTSGATFTVDNTSPVNQDSIFALSATNKGGDTITITSSGDVTNNVWFAPSGTTVFVAGPTMAKAANGIATSILAPANEGNYRLFVLDAAGNYSAPSTAILTVDNTAPTFAANGLVLKGNTGGSSVYINGMVDSDNLIAKAEITLQDNVTGNIQVQFSETSVAGTWGAYNGVSNVLDVDDSWSVGEYKTITLTAASTDQTLTAANVWKFAMPDALKTLYVRVKDVAGNVSITSNDTITLDTTLPAVFDLSAPVSLTWTGLVQPSLTWGASSDALSGMHTTAPYKLYIDDTFNKDVTGTTTTPVSALSAGAHTWYIKAQDESGNLRQSTSTRTLNVVDLIAPEGGATIWEEGSQHRKITWVGHAGVTADTVKIEYSKDGGATWAFCKDLSNSDYINVPIADGDSGKTWNIPANFTDGGGVDWANCKVRITSNTLAGIEEVSDIPFTVRRYRVSSITAPASGNIWRMGGTYDVNWVTAGIPDGAAIKLKYSVADGNAGTWRNMAGELLTQAEGGPVGGTGIPTSAVNGVNGGTYSWTIPAITGINCKVKVSYTLTPKIWENTSAGFQIKSADLLINTPAGTDRLIRGDAYNISWAVTGTASGNWNIKCIYLDTGYNQVIENIFTGPIAYSSHIGNNYNYSWTWNIPANHYVSDLVNIEVSDSADSTISDDTYNNASLWMRILKAPTEDVNLFAISQPLSTTSWYINSTKNINWLFAEPLVGANMSIYYALGPGYNTWVLLNSNAACVEGSAPMGGAPVPAGNSWAWGIDPGISVGSAKIKVYDNGRQTTERISEAFNLIAPTVSITTPAADEELIAGTTYTISWDGTDGVGGNINTLAGLKNKMTLKCVTQNDPEWTITAAAVHDPARLPNPGGSFAIWTVNDTVQDSAEDSIAVDTATITISDNSRIATTNQRTFKIKEPSISFTSPLLDEQWIAGTQHNVSWTSSIGVGNKVSLYWSSVNSPSYTLINNNVDHDTVNKAGVFLLTVPDTNPGLSGDVAKLKIVDNTRAGTVFTRQFKIVQPVINILTPTLGETLRSGEVYPITWNTTDGVSNSVKIEYYSPDVGIGWAVAAGGGAVANVKGGTVNTFNWTVPVISTVQFGPNMAKVRITDNNRLATVTESNGFDIASPGINVGAPASGTTWRIGSVQEINWVTIGVQGDNLQVIYDKTGNFTGSEVDITLQGTFGVSPRRSFTWNIPLNEATYAASGTAKIKVKDLDAPYAEGISSAFSVARQVITLNEPATPVSWILGTDNHSIGWSMQGKINKVNIEYSPLGTWADTKVIQTNYVITDASGLYQNYSMNYLWTLPNDDTYLSNNTGKIRIRSTDPALPVETSNISGVFSVVVPQFNNITVTAPSGETELFVGDTATISWAWTGSLTGSLKGNTKVSYSIDGTNWTVCAGADALVNTTASYNWVIPAGAVSAGATRIKVEDLGVGRSATTAISSLYTVKAQPAITISSPVGTPDWKVGSAYTISWASTEGIHANKVEVGVSTGDMVYSMIAGDQPVTGSVIWTVPAGALAITHSLSAGQVQVKDTVRALSAVLGDVSPVAAINVIANINLTQPLNLVVGDIYNISWTSSGTFTPLRLQLSADNGATWYDMGYTTPGGYTVVVNSGGPDTYSWTVPNAVTAQALVRIYDPAYPAQVVVPSAAFNIGPEPNLTITAPTGVTSYRVGSAGNNISWTGSANSNDNIELSYSIDNGSTWPVIVSGKLKSDTYSWTVPQAALAPGAISVIAKLRVRDMSRLATQMTHLPREVTILPPAINVNNLNNYLVITDTQGISWASVGGEDGATFTAAIKYNSPSSGWAFVTGGNSVVSNANADTTFNWVVPNDLGVSQVQVYDTYRPATSIGLSNNFTICGKFDSVSVSSANLSIGGTAQISWTTTGVIPADQVELLYFIAGDFAGAQVIDAAVSAKTSPYVWTIPVDIAGSFINSDLKIRIRDKRVPLNSVSYKDSGICKIKGGFSAPSSPAEGAEWNVGTAYNITWTTIGNISFVKLYYTANSSDVTPVWTIMDAAPGWELTNNSNGQTTFSWMVPDAVTSDARIKVVDAGNAEAYAVSGQFKIKGGVDLLTPNGGENWIIGTSHNITWNTTLGTIANVKLEYSVNGGASWAPVAENEGIANDGIVANDGTFTWNIPDAYSETAKVRVSEASGASNIDISANYFVMASPVLTVIQPGSAQNGNASLSMLEPFDVKWSTVGSSQNNLKIEVSYDNMATWNTVVESVANSSPYTYSWAPASTSNQAWVRITEIELNNYHPAAAAVSDGTFTILAVPMINVTGPATGEKWLLGKQYAISWNTQGLVFNNLRISYTLDSTAPIPVWTDIANDLPNSGSYIWTLPDLVSVLTDQTKAQIKIKDDTKGTIGTTGNFTIGIPTVIVNRPAGGEIFAVGETVPITWVNNGGIIGPLTIQYDASGTVTNASPTIATGVDKTGEVPGGYSYAWTVPSSAQTSTVKVRIKDSQRPNSRGDSAADFSVIPAPVIEVSSPANGNVFVVEEQMPVNWTVRGLSVGNVNIEYWDDLNSNDMLDGGEIMRPIITGISRGASDTSDAYSGKYTGAYAWTIPANTVSSSGLKLRVADPVGGYAGFSSGHFRIRGGFEFRDEAASTQVFSSSVDWKAKTTHNIKWYNKGSFDSVKLEYKAASSEGGLSSEPWTAIIASTINSPNSGNISSYSWVVADPHQSLYPLVPPENYFVKLKISSVADPTISAESSAFKVSYYTVTWKLKDYDSMTSLNNSSVMATGGGINYWNVANDGLSFDSGVNYYTRRFPYSTVSSTWSKEGYISRSDSDRVVNANVEATILLESVISAQMQYKVYSAVAYNEDNQELKVSTWLEKKGTLINPSDVDLGAGGNSYIKVYDGETLIKTSISPGADSNGNFWFTVINATKPIAEGGIGLISGKTYFVKVGIYYRSRLYESGSSFDITISQKLKAVTDLIGETTRTIEIATNQIAAQSQFLKETVRSETEAITETLTTRMSKVLTATETVLPTKIEAQREAIISEVVQQVEPHIQSGILNRDTMVKQGEDVTIRYRTASGLSPKVDVYDPNNLQKVSQGVMKEVGNTGVYEYTVKFDSRWDKGDYTVMTSESTKGTLDAMVMTAQSTSLEDVASQTSGGVALTSSDVEGLATALTSQLDTISSTINTLAATTGEALKSGANSNMDAMVSALKKAAKDIKDLGGVEGYNLDDLFEVSDAQSKDLKYLANKTAELKKLLELVKQLMEKNSEELIIQTWYESGSVIIRSLVVNPSKKNTRTVPFKQYLPKEVKSGDIMDKGDLELTYDTQQGMYFVHQDIELAPGESKKLAVEIEDIWVIDEKEVRSLREQATKYYDVLKETPFVQRADFLLKKVDNKLSEVMARQGNAVMVNPEEHISVYRENVKVLESAKEDILEMERISRGTFHISPLATWWMIVIIVIFLAVLSLFFFLVWQKKLKKLNVTADEIIMKEKEKEKEDYSGSGEDKNYPHLPPL